VARRVLRHLDVPARPRIAETGAADHAGSVHQPNHSISTVVLPNEVGKLSPAQLL
jgi:hypothetical protein